MLSKYYDVFLCFGWPAAAICYLANVNYVMYFVDSYIDPEYRIRKKVSFIKKYILNQIYKDALRGAGLTIAAVPYDAKIVRKYRKDTRIIFTMIDPDMFNPDVKKKQLNQNKFVFFSPQRIDPDKNTEIMWKAIKLTKSDFVVLQTDWGSGDYYDKMIATKPEKVKIIPRIKRQEIAHYYVSVDALLGQIGMTTCGSVEREAALCKIPIFCYAPFSFAEDDPFYKKNKNPEEIAEYIDKIVTNKEFREKLSTTQNEWVRKTFDNNKLANQWMDVFEEIINKKRIYKTKLQYKIIVHFITVIEKILRRDFSSMARNVN